MTFLLVFVVPPQILPLNFGEDSVNSGDVASLQCTVFKGDFPLNITWLHNNKTIGYNSGILIIQNGKKVSSLTIESVSEAHMGTYSCLVQNAAGTSSYSVELNVNGIIRLIFLILFLYILNPLPSFPL